MGVFSQRVLPAARCSAELVNLLGSPCALKISLDSGLGYRNDWNMNGFQC